MNLTRLGSILLGLAAGVSSSIAADISPAMNSAGVRITELTNRLRIEINGQLFSEYYFKDVARPYYYPLLGPEETAMTRHWPLQDVPNEEHDHPHHRSLWFSHSAVNGQDCWTEGTGTIVHTGFEEIISGTDAGVIRSRDNWVATNGDILCSDVRTFRVYASPDNQRIFDFEVTLIASHGDVTFGDNKDGAMALRVAETMRLKPNKFYTNETVTGHIVNSEGVRDGQTWGKRADWCDYYGPVDGKTVGIAIFDNPQNPRHPTWWHVRDYGLFAANPFGQNSFENTGNKNAGNFLVPSGTSVTFRYRFYLHEGDEKQAKVAEHYQDYVKTISPLPK